MSSLAMTSSKGGLAGGLGAVWKQASAIARKELGAYFGSPMALIFVGAFLVATLFAFFWAETFFSRNVADVRPLFRWMPILMIFLVAALTMRQWSEEQRAGTLEVLLTLPVRRSALVAGKFMAVMSLVILSLALTLFLPITVSILGDLDWGPVFGGYLAAILLAGAYAAIGLYISSRTDNQIVSLLLTALICGVFYLVGTSGVSGLFGGTPAQILRAIGTGSRFESIERGVIDLRDLLYYLSLILFFLALNMISLDSKRWGRGGRTFAHRWNAVLRVVLIGANLLALNFWIFPLHPLRADLTANREYSLSPATRDLIGSLDEPVLIRGYFSERTHPLLAPLVPALQDIMREYAIASGGGVQVEFLDPRQNEELEAEANQIYGIRPTPFRIAGRYEESLISSYFDILVRYGDQHMTLSFADLIEVRPAGGGQFEVGLRNPEYDLTRAIKRVVYGFQSLEAVFAGLDKPVTLTAIVTPQTLPGDIGDLPERIKKVADEIAAVSNGMFAFGELNPDDPNAPMNRRALWDAYGLQPFSASLFSSETFYLHLLLEIGDEVQVMYPNAGMSEAELRSEIEAALRRAAPGFLKTVGMWTPSEDPIPHPFGGQVQPISSWQMLQAQLAQDYTVRQVDLSGGRVPGDIDVLVLVGPADFTDTHRYAVDQYLMRGGAVVVALGNYGIAPIQFGDSLLMAPAEESLHEMLAHYGVALEPGMVLDPQNEPFPVQVQRTVAGMNVIEVQQVNYPYFVDVRSDGMASESPIVANLSAVTLQWSSPLTVDAEKTANLEVVELLRSTPASWLLDDTNVQPDSASYPQYGFPVQGEQSSHVLAVSLRGSLSSYFKGRPSPLETMPSGMEAGEGGEGTPTPQPAAPGTVEVSPESARLVVIGSHEFLDDAVLNISRNLSAERYLNNLQLLQNAVDWATEDEDLLSIRSRGTYARMLRPLDSAEQSLWETLNYGVALAGLVAIGLVWNRRRRHVAPLPLLDDEERQEKDASMQGGAK